MSRPTSLFNQYEGKAAAELLRGSGSWPLQKRPCHLEPPWDDYDAKAASVWDCYVNDWIGPWHENSWLSWLTGDAPVVHRLGTPIVLPQPAEALNPEVVKDLVPVTVEQFPEDEATLAKAEQLLLSLSRLSVPVAFEVLGLGRQSTYDGLIDGREILQARQQRVKPSGWHDPSITVQFVSHRRDAARIESQLLAHYPNSAVVTRDDGLDFATDLLPGFDLLDEHGYASTLHLDQLYCWPLKTYRRLDSDPLGVAIAVMDQLGPDDWGIVQVLLEPAQHDWAHTVQQAVRDPYKPGKFIFNDISQRLLDEKFGSSLFAVSVRIAARRQEHYLQLRGWAQQFANPPQQLSWHDDENYGDLSWSLLANCTFRPAMLLNSSELAGLVHLPAPSVTSERLRRVATRTRAAAPSRGERGSVVLGDNVHQGRCVTARIPAELRDRHAYIAGQTGTGKSTLLLNMIMQDIAAGQGVGVIDPHGDLISDVLARIPRQRAKDVVYFNPTDGEFPPAFNILGSRDPDERERLVSETLSTLQRFSASPWGSRFEHIFRNALATLLQFNNATLADVPRLLMDAAFRRKVLLQLSQPDLLSFWNNEFPNLPKGACDPILNRLSATLLNRRIRNIVCQRQGKINFDTVINRQTIFLANLCSGTLTEEATGIFGTFLMAKLIAATFRRAALAYEKRRPFYLYVDEFQTFLQSAIGFDKILSEARKYRLILTVANQYVSQLTPQVRAAIIGNVGTMVCFRLGTADAQLLSNEFGVFTSNEILALERGQALARLGGTQNAFNLSTYPPPARADEDLTAAIVAHCRKHYAVPRRDVEATLLGESDSSAKPADKGRKQPPDKQPTAPEAQKAPIEIADEEWDRWDDFVS